MAGLLPSPGTGSPDPFLVDSAAHVFVTDLDAPVPDGEDGRHLSRVLRLRPGEPVTASDGAGRWRRCRWRGAGRVDLVTDGPVVVQPRPAPAVTVGFSLVKGDRPERVVRQLTELGVDRVVPLATARSVVRWEGERGRQHLARLRRVSREAAMQARLAWLPEVTDVGGVDQVARESAPAAGAALARPGGPPPDLGRPTVLVGPEGGWDDRELACGLPVVGLGPTVLRTETAAVVVGALLCALRAGTVAKA
ncbi:MAG TPA: RsmE family RNA methyltransferase [Acidimicrobiales bacterium]|nr:RsmE family RNA methyltransferase [Acidimicrobiales bacterium]